MFYELTRLDDESPPAVDADAADISFRPLDDLLFDAVADVDEPRSTSHIRAVYDDRPARGCRNNRRNGRLGNM